MILPNRSAAFESILHFSGGYYLPHEAPTVLDQYGNTAGAGSIMTVMLLTNNAERSVVEQAQTTGVLAACLVLLFTVLALSGGLSRLLGRGGLEIVTRVFGLILTSIAVNNLIVAIKLSFNLA